MFFYGLPDDLKRPKEVTWFTCGNNDDDDEDNNDDDKDNDEITKMMTKMTGGQWQVSAYWGRLPCQGLLSSAQHFSCEDEDVAFCIWYVVFFSPILLKASILAESILADDDDDDKDDIISLVRMRILYFFHQHCWKHWWQIYLGWRGNEDLILKMDSSPRLHSGCLTFWQLPTVSYSTITASKMHISTVDIFNGCFICFYLFYSFSSVLSATYCHWLIGTM